MIEIKNLNHFYGRLQALKEVTTQVPASSITGLIGQNGAGKSTLLKVLAGYLVPASGEVIVDGLSYAQEPLEVRRRIGYMPETPYLYREMRVREYLEFVGKLKGLTLNHRHQECERLTEHCGLKKIYHKLIGNLSKGNRQRVALAQALMGKPRVLLLDEPTSALDPAQVIEIRQLIQSQKGSGAVLMSSHVLSEISQICNHIIFINAGEVRYEGASQDLSQAKEGESRLLIIRFSEFHQEWTELFTSIPGGKLRSPGGREMIFEVLHEGIFFPAFLQLASEKRIPLREMTFKGSSLETLFQSPQVR